MSPCSFNAFRTNVGIGFFARVRREALYSVMAKRALQRLVMAMNFLKPICISLFRLTISNKALLFFQFENPAMKLL
jgi:hypothetical protein